MVSKRRVIIVGGGASGVLLAAHLLRAEGTAVGVTLIERSPCVGKGLAYGTTHRHFLLNVRAANMSAFADAPDHFARWLAVHGDTSERAEPARAFAQRRAYGRYLASLIEPHLAAGDAAGARLQVVHGEAMAADVRPDSAAVTLSDGTVVGGDCVVLATGNEPQPDQHGVYASPWLASEQVQIPRTASVTIRGTGLTMIDFVLALQTNGHTGPIYALSRRGCLPQVHRPAAATIDLGLRREQVPIGTELVHLWCWLRSLIRRSAEQGIDWRTCIDALRPFSWELWRQLPSDSKRRFLRHARAWWDVHRHRMAPEIAERVGALIASGQLRVIAARIAAVNGDGAGLRVTYRRRGRSDLEQLHADHLVDCSGVQSSPAQSANPLIRDLVTKGLARGDALDLGLDVGTGWALIDADGTTSDRLFAIGPVTRGAAWETIAIPDIRLQCAELTGRLLAAMAPRKAG